MLVSIDKRTTATAQRMFPPGGGGGYKSNAFHTYNDCWLEYTPPSNEFTSYYAILVRLIPSTKQITQGRPHTLTPTVLPQPAAPYP
jgi:hypothetical protein